MLKPGLYEQVINNRIDEELGKVSEEHKNIVGIDKAEAANVLAQYVSSVVKNGLDNMSEGDDSLGSQVELVNKIIQLVGENSEGFSDYLVDEKGSQLLGLLDATDPDVIITGRRARDMVRPETSVAHSSLFTGASHEPQMYNELKKEIATADRIDMLVSFIKWSGLRLIINELRTFVQHGGKLRIITTSYMGATDAKAVGELAKLGNTEIKISYDTDITRLHAKSYVFYRDSGFTTAYVGSSNLSNAAISSGLEWNLKITETDQVETLQKIKATFDSYWNSSEFELYTENSRDKLEKALKAEGRIRAEGSWIPTFDIRPYQFQQEILDKLKAERELRDHNRNLLVAATGCGKTVISAFDYKNYCDKNKEKKNRLLFVAHREEILRQSLATFQVVLSNQNFGELYYGKSDPKEIDHIFASINSINSRDLCTILKEDYFDFIIVDEFHHAAAPSYQDLLSHFKPKILLGLTATPERMDGKDILEYFDGRIAAEIRLPEAIDRKLLCPFQYFGISDTVDLDDLKWTRGGYDRSELSNVYTMDRAVAERRANYVLGSMKKYVTDMQDVKALGFCVSIEHASFMAEHFNEQGIKAIALSSKSSDDERSSAKKKLVSGEITIIFVVDLYNEGVDIKEVNTVLFLRPTESLTVFLQQLGRGLRLSPGKECLTVLDFVGQANRNYDFESKFQALLSNTKHSVQHEIMNGFSSLPRGCYLQLEKKAANVILENIKRGFTNRKGLIDKIKDFYDDMGCVPTVSQFVKHNHLKPGFIYKNDLFSRLCVQAEILDDFAEPAEEVLKAAFRRFVPVDSRRWLKFMIEMLKNIETFDFEKLSGNDKRMFQMFYVTVYVEAADPWNDSKMQNRIKNLQESPKLIAELVDLLEYNYSKIDFVDVPSTIGFDCPLDVYCSYSRDQIFVALDYLKPNNIRQGVKWLGDKKLDVFMVTLNKSDKDYSPTTMYEDYSINSEFFHWQSQSTTSDDSHTGQRYINHDKMGSRVSLFVREFKKDEFGNTEPYMFLGPVEYVSHEGSRPMSIVWRMKEKIPAKYLKKTNKLVIG